MPDSQAPGSPRVNGSTPAGRVAKNPGIILLTNKIQLDDDDRAWALPMANKWKRGPHYNPDLEREYGPYVGYLGERALLKHYPGSRHVDGTRHDIGFRDKTYDAKTMVVNVEPRDNYWVNVHHSDSRRTQGYYLFNYIPSDYSMVYHLGWISVEEFNDLAIFHEQGAKGDNGFTYQCDTYVVRVSQLYPPLLGGAFPSEWEKMNARMDRQFSS